MNSRGGGCFRTDGDAANLASDICLLAALSRLSHSIHFHDQLTQLLRFGLSELINFLLQP